MQSDSGKRLRFGMVIPCNVGGSVHEHRDSNELLACKEKNMEHVTIANLSSKIEDMEHSMKEHQSYIQNNLDTAGIIGHENNQAVRAENARRAAEKARENAETARATAEREVVKAENAKALAEEAKANVEVEKNKRISEILKCCKSLDLNEQGKALNFFKAIELVSMDTTSGTQIRRVASSHK